MSRIAKALSLRHAEGEKFSYLLVLVVLISGGLVVGGLQGNERIAVRGVVALKGAWQGISEGAE